jgi:hypothetical protein
LYDAGPKEIPMPDVNIHRPKLRLTEDADAVQYRAISGMAIAACAIGAASPAAFYSPLAWVLPMAGVVVGVMALRRIRAEAPALLGRKPALVGLTLSLIVLGAAPVELLAYRRMLQREARQFGSIFFEHLRNDEPHKAYQLTLYAQQRQPLRESFRESYPEGSDAEEKLVAFVSKPEIRAVLALGKNAEIRYYDTESYRTDEGIDGIEIVYAVTYRSDGEPRSFFITAWLARMPSLDVGRSFWMVKRLIGGGKPSALGGEPR